MLFSAEYEDKNLLISLIIPLITINQLINPIFIKSIFGENSKMTQS